MTVVPVVIADVGYEAGWRYVEFSPPTPSVAGKSEDVISAE